MARFDQLTIFKQIENTRMVPVFYNSNIETARSVIKACYEGGVRVFEFTNRGDFALEVFTDIIKYAAKECPEMIIGAGTVIDAPTAVMYMQVGANFIVGPMFNPEIAKVCNRRSVPYIPGCATVSEVNNAQEVGCWMCKVFPGDVYGPKFIKGMLAPMPWSKIMVTGGVEPTKENLTAWMKAGVFAVGMGSKLFPKEVVAEKNWNAISDKARECIAILTEK